MLVNNKAICVVENEFVDMRLLLGGRTDREINLSTCCVDNQKKIFKFDCILKNAFFSSTLPFLTRFPLVYEKHSRNKETKYSTPRRGGKKLTAAVACCRCKSSVMTRREGKDPRKEHKPTFGFTRFIS